MVKHWQVGLFAVLFILGLLLSVQLRTEKNIRVSLPTRRVNELASMLREQENKRKVLEEQLMNARSEKASFIDNSEVRKLQTILGLTQVEGSGLLVTLNDSSRQLRRGEDPADLIVHSDQLEMVVNELWAAGAEAVSVNGERIIINTGFSCAGTTILVNTRRLAPPYIIKAIGDPSRLEAALGIQDGILDYLRLSDLQVSESQQDRLIIPAFKGSLQQSYVVPSKEVN
jgi:uncharacterized protein YlxW (UPF0749 family)